MLMIVLTVLFLAGIVWWTHRSEKTHRTKTLTQEADDAMRTMRRVAKRRANQASIPIPMAMDLDSTPVHGTVVPAGVPMRAPTSQPYAQHHRKNNLKIVKR